MGVLDDAIREHLELKRRHGAAEEELRRQEEEALGPARREVAPAETEEEATGAELRQGEQETLQGTHAGEAALAEPDATAAEAPETGVEAAPVGEDDLDEATALHDEVALRDEPALHDDIHQQPEGAEEPPLEDEAAVDEQASLHDDASERAVALDDETALYEIEEHFDEEDEPGAERFSAPTRGGDTPPQGFEALDDDEPLDEEGEAGDGDVLEDTPDFLQETPEHDRLWFEQKPPRDFDFD
jgi:hypothetical protein